MVTSPRIHLLPLLGATLSLVLFSLHNLSGMLATGFNYTPFSVAFQISPVVYDESHYYATGPKHFQVRGGFPGEVDLYELRDVPNGHPLFHSMLLGGMARILGRDWGLERAWILGHALFPTLIWVVLYLIAKAVTGHTWLSMALAWITTLFPFGPRNALLLSPIGWIQPIEITRLASPGLTLVLLLLAIDCSWKGIFSGRRGWLAAAAIASGSLFYAYYFYWVAWYAAGGCLMVVLLFLRLWPMAARLPAILGIGVLLAAPQLLRNFNGMHHGGQRELMARMGDYTRAVNWPALVALAPAMLLVAWCLSRKRSAERAWLLLSIMAALLFGGLVGLNFHVITGFDAQHTHFYNRLLQPLGCFFVPLAVLAWLEERGWRSLWRAAVVSLGAASVLLLCLGIYRQVRVGIDTAVHHRASDSRMATLLWIREHLPPQAVIGSSDDRLFLLIPAVTGNWTFVPMGLRSMAPTREILLRYLLLSALEGKQWHEIRDTLTRKRLGDTFGSVIVQPMIGAVQLSPRALAMVESMWNHGKLDQELAARKLDYLIVEADRPVETMRLRYPKTVFVNHDWRVLDVRADSYRTLGATAPYSP